MNFVRNAASLAKIAVPGWKTPEVLHLIILSALLVVRTMLSISISSINGQIVKGIVCQDFKEFILQLGKLAAYAVPSSLVNSGLDYLQKRLGIMYRSRLSEYFNQKYLSGLTYYQVTNLDERVPNPDQRLTSDIEKFATALSCLYSNVSKPVLDIVLFSRRLAELVGWEGPLAVSGWYILSGIIIKFISPQFSRLTVIEQELEGEYRACQSDLINYSEEITFYRGDSWERERANNTYRKLSSHRASIIFKRFFMGIFDSVLVKYGATIVALMVLGLPVFGPRSGDYIAKVASDPSAITKDYIRNFSLLINLAKAIGRLVVSYKDIQNLAGFTHLTIKLKEVLEGLEKGQYTRTLVDGSSLDINARGEVIKPCESIKFDNIDVFSPNGNDLIRNLNFTIEPGMHVFIHGPNGCGKSSLFRVLAELWPVYSGKLQKPEPGDIFYIAQNAYCPKGTLRDQLIYPHSLEECRARGISDEDLEQIMHAVKLTKVVKRESWNDVRDWKQVLSGGEKQKMAMGRLYYHKPKFAVLDECTSAVHKDSEGELYSLFKEANISMITISHREGLLQYHDYVLNIDDSKNWTFSQVDKSSHVI